MERGGTGKEGKWLGWGNQLYILSAFTIPWGCVFMVYKTSMQDPDYLYRFAKPWSLGRSLTSISSRWHSSPGAEFTSGWRPSPRPCVLLGAAIIASVLTSIWVILFQELKASEALSQPFPSFSLSVSFFQGKGSSNSSHVYVSDFFFF